MRPQPAMVPLDPRCRDVRLRCRLRRVPDRRRGPVRGELSVGQLPGRALPQRREHLHQSGAGRLERRQLSAVFVSGQRHVRFLRRRPLFGLPERWPAGEKYTRDARRGVRRRQARRARAHAVLVRRRLPATRRVRGRAVGHPVVCIGLLHQRPARVRCRLVLRRERALRAVHALRPARQRRAVRGNVLRAQQPGMRVARGSVRLQQCDAAAGGAVGRRLRRRDQRVELRVANVCGERIAVLVA